MNIEQYTNFLLTHLPDAHLVSGGKEINCRCLYCDDKNNSHRRAIQTVLYHLLKTHLILLQPIMPLTTSEAYSFFNTPFKKEDIFFEKWIDQLDENIPPIDENKWKQIFKLKDLVFTAIEAKRNTKIINKSNETEITIEFNNCYQIDTNLLKKIFNVAKVIIKHNQSLDAPKVIVDKTIYVKCIRCWNYYPSDQIHDEICPRCQKILDKLS